MLLEFHQKKKILYFLAFSLLLVLTLFLEFKLRRDGKTFPVCFDDKMEIYHLFLIGFALFHKNHQSKIEMKSYKNRFIIGSPSETNSTQQ